MTTLTLDQPPPGSPPLPGTHWSAAEDDLMRAEYGRRPAADLAAQLGRGVEATRLRARVLGLASPVRARITWTAAADAILRDGYRRQPTADLAARLGTTTAAVSKRAQGLGLSTPIRRDAWSDDDDRLLRDFYGAMPMADIVARLGRSRTSVFGRLTALGLTRVTAVAGRYARDQAEISRLQAETEHLREAAPVSADARRLAVLVGYRMSVIMADEAAVVLGVPIGRLPVELGKAAKLGLDVVRDALGGRR